MKKIFFAIATVCLALTTVSCDRDLAKFSYDDNPCVYFESGSMTFDMNASDGGVITVPVKRLNDKGNIEVPFTFTDGSEGLFSCTQNTVNFKDGETEATITVNHSDLSKFKLFTKYPFTLNISGGKYVEVSGIGNGKPYVTAKAQKEVVKTTLGTATIDSEWYEDVLEATVACAEEEKNHYYIYDVYGAGAGYDLEFVVNGNEVSVVDGVPVDIYPPYGDVCMSVIKASASGKVVTITAEFYVSAGSFGTCTEVITLP